MKGKKYEWLYFDLDNTILDFDASSELAFYEMFTGMGLSLTAVDFAAYKKINRGVWDKLDKGLIDHNIVKAERWRLFLKELNHSADPLVVNSLYFSHIKKNPIYVSGAEKLLSDLKGNYKLCLITNGIAEVQWPRIRLMDLEAVFDEIVISEEVGISKPMPGFFDHCQELNGHPDKADILIIGDTLGSDIKGGNLYGIDTCWYNYHGEVNKTDIQSTYQIDKLEELLDLI